MAIKYIFLFYLSFFQINSPIDNWIGHWQGEVEIYTKNGLSQTVPMQLIIQETETENEWTWTIIYAEGDNEDKRPYILILPNPEETSEFLIDEKNGIVLQTQFFNDIFFSSFEVSNNLLTFVYRLDNENEKPFIEVEIVVTKTESPTITGLGTEEIPEVKTFPVRVYQKAILYKKE